jgi:hypothetical protein
MNRTPVGPPALDEAFLPISELLPLLLPDIPDLVDEEAGIRSRMVACEVDTPVELDIQVSAGGQVVLGGVPPLYHEQTTWLPVFHRVRLTAVREEA